MIRYRSMGTIASFLRVFKVNLNHSIDICVFRGRNQSLVSRNIVYDSCEYVKTQSTSVVN
jgi:hypothetical protein